MNGEIDRVKVLARKSGGVKFWTNLMSENWVPRLPLFFNPVTIINSQEEVLLSSLEEFAKTRFRWGRWEMQLRD